MQNIYTVVLRLPCAKYKTIRVEADNEELANKIAIKQFKDCEGVTVACTSDKSESFSISANVHRVQYESPELKQLTDDVAEVIKKTFHKHTCKCEADPFYALLKSNDVGQRVQSAISDGDVAMINLAGTINDKEYKVTIRLEEVK